MYIQPNSDIIILKNIPLDNTYDHTLWFQSKTEQHDWFYLYHKYEFNKYSYQRLNRGYIKIEKSADDLYDCNYMMYRNTAYGNKWFYAFIKTIEYVNDNVSQIEFEIDVMQTWFFDYQLGQSFVVREHSKTDEIGDNILPEDVPLGDYNIASESDVIWKSAVQDPTKIGVQDWAIVVVCNFDYLSESYVHGCNATNQFSGLYYNIFTNDGTRTAVDKVKDFLDMLNHEGILDRVFNIFYMFGEFAVDTTVATYPFYNKPLETPNVIEKIVPDYLLGFKNDYNKPDSGEGSDPVFYPRNKKLYTYPYNYLKLTDFRGSEVEYKYEFFSEKYTGQTPGLYGYKFFLTGDLSPSPSVIAIPDNYLKDDGLGRKGNLDYAFVLSDFPQCTWSGDAFTAWFAQTSYRVGGALTATVIGQGFRGVANGIMTHLNGKPFIGESGTPQLGNEINGIMANLGAQAGEAVRKGSNVYGNQTGALGMAMNKIGIFACNMKIRKDYAKIIDSYFDRFGYKTMQTKVPNTHVRTSWTYTQTLGCVLSLSNLPADDAKKICSIYDKGVTFWDRYAVVGNYNQTNAILPDN